MYMYVHTFVIKCSLILCRSQQLSKLSLDDSNVTVKRNLIIFLIVCMAVMTLIVFMTRVSSRRDPSQNLDWKINPNIRTGQ